MAITKEVLDELLKGYKGPEDITGPEGLLKQLTKTVIERAMQGELTEQLGYEKGEQGEKPGINRRKGTLKKTLRDGGPTAMLRFSLWLTLVTEPGNAKLSFFGDLRMGRVGAPTQTDDGIVSVASSLDLLGTKLKVIIQRSLYSRRRPKPNTRSNSWRGASGDTCCARTASIANNGLRNWNRSRGIEWHK